MKCRKEERFKESVGEEKREKKNGVGNTEDKTKTRQRQ